MNWNYYFLAHINNQVLSLANGVSLKPVQILVLIAMAHMMIIGFVCLYLIFRRNAISTRFLLLVLALLLYMCVITFVISYIGFWSDISFAAIPVIMLRK